MLRDRQCAGAQARAEETRASLGKRPCDERPALRVEKVERDEDGAAAALHGLGAESPGEEVVARSTARIADDDLAVEDRPLRQPEVRDDEPDETAFVFAPLFLAFSTEALRADMRSTTVVSASGSGASMTSFFWIFASTSLRIACLYSSLYSDGSNSVAIMPTRFS